MDTHKNTFPFPQANDFSKVLEIMAIEEESWLNDKSKMSAVLGYISERQVDYYINAAGYLGLIDRAENGKKFSELGIKFRNKSISAQEIFVTRLILSNPIFGTVYLQEKKYRSKMTLEEIVEIMRDYLNFDEPMYLRRASTVRSWVKWINNKFNDDL